MNRILVTGGAGFIGSHLCRDLLKKGNEVICIDNFITGRKSNISCLKSDSFEVIRHDITEELSAVSYIDKIYNLASPASPEQYWRYPVKTLMTSVLGSYNMLELAKESGAKILQTSTSEIYGDPIVHPQDEKYYGNVDPIGPRACYDEGKRCAETLFSLYSRRSNTSMTRIARIFNTYGPNMAVDDGRVISNFIVSALKKEDIIIHGDGQQTRSFCYVDDMVRGLQIIMDNNDSLPINIGNDHEITINELAFRVLEISGSSSKIKNSAQRQGDPKKRKPDLTRIKALKWKPEISLKCGLKKTIEYFDRMLTEG